MSVFKIKYQGKEYDVQEGITYKEFIDTSLNINSTDVALCRLNRKYHELFKDIDSNGEIELIMFDSPIGYKIYTRTLQFIFIKATLDLFDNSVITIEHSIGEGVFGELHKEEALSAEDIDKIKLRMKEIIEKDLPINKIKVKIEKAIEIFKEYGMDDKVSLLNQVSFENVNLYELDGRYDYFYGQMAYSTGVIKAFEYAICP